MKREVLRFALAQINPTVGDFHGNSEKICRAIFKAREQHAQIVTFPELALTGYPPEDLLFKESFISDNLKTLHAILPHTRGLLALIGFVDRGPDGALYNAMAVCDDGKLVGRYHKMWLPNYGVFDEKRYFGPGAKPVVLNFGGIRLGLSICEDIWDLAGTVYQNGYSRSVSALINISASPYHVGKQKERESLLARLAARIQAPVIYQNLVGGQDELVFDGGSMVVDKTGRTVAAAGRFEEELLFCDVPVLPEAHRRRGKLFSRTIRVFLKKGAAGNPPRTIFAAPPKPLSKDAEVYKALVLGTKDYIRKNKFKKVLVGLSGGIDSALVARIAVDALGAENVIGVTMPSRYTSSGTYQDAKSLAARLGISCLEFTIEKIFSSYLKTLKRIFEKTPSDITEENLQARIRGNLLMALSNKFGYMVLTTGNKSEMATGYCTLYGDMAGGFAVIKDVPKTLVFRLAQYRNALPPKDSIPRSILRRPPTAELRPNQKDQDTLPPYAVLDRILEGYIEKDLSIGAMARQRTLGKDLTRKTAWMVDKNEYKRRQAPPGVKITPKAFGRDRRMPITNRYGL